MIRLFSLISFRVISISLPQRRAKANLTLAPLHYNVNQLRI